MDQASHHKIVSFIWGIADDVLRDLFKRGKYPDVILPMCVIRRMDAVLEPTKWSTLAHDAFPAREFDFMLANPPYGKSWKKDLEAMGGKDGMRDPRFKVMHQARSCRWSRVRATGKCSSSPTWRRR
jgi:type I restriction-modification system DNA methylase subunit